MRNVLYILLAAGVIGAATSEIRAADKDTKQPPKVVKWEKDLESAYAKSLDTKKPLVIVFLCPLEDAKCVHCKRFRGSVFSDEFSELADDAIFVQANIVLVKGGKVPDELAQRTFEKLGLTTTPTISVMEPNPKVLAEIGRIKGYFDREKLTGHVRDVLGKWVKGGRKLTEKVDG